MPFSISNEEILETVKMLSEDKLDIRTITMGINLQDCTAENAETIGRKMYDKISSYAERLVPVGEQIEQDYGIPIINKRIAVSPVSGIVGALPVDDMVVIGTYLDKAA